MADIVRANYQQLDQIANKFKNEAEQTRAMLQKVKGAMEPLQSGGWIGKGSDAFFNEMNGKIIPAVNRLAQALQEAASKTKEIANTLRQAEQEGANPFQQMRM